MHSLMQKSAHFVLARVPRGASYKKVSGTEWIMGNAIMEKRAPTSTAVKCGRICMSGRGTFRFVLFVDSPRIAGGKRNARSFLSNPLFPSPFKKKTEMDHENFSRSFSLIVEEIPQSVRTSALRSTRPTAGNWD